MTDRPPFVLVHGGRHGGWCWKRVARLLRAAGHDVFTPTLTGLGERQHLLSPSIGLETHVADLLGVFEAEELNGAVLVAHSYGGVVACGATETLRSRVRSLVLLDAHMPDEGQSVFDLVDPEKTKVIAQRVSEEGDGWYVPVSDAQWWGIDTVDDLRWVNARVTPQPVKTYMDASGATTYARTHPYTFIECSRSGMHIDELKWQRARAEQHPESIRHIVIEGGHDIMVTEPEELARQLLAAVDAPKGPPIG